MQNIPKAILNFVCTAVIALRGLAVCNAGVLNVPDTYPGIQEGIDAAAPGDTVRVAAGVYSVTNSIRLNKSIALEAATGAIICGVPDAAVITCDHLSQPASVSGFAIVGGLCGIQVQGTTAALIVRSNSLGALMIGTNIFANHTAAIRLEPGSSALIEYNDLSGPPRGVDASGASSIRIFHNSFSWNRGSYGGGIVLDGVTNALIWANDFFQCWDGAINISDCGTTTIVANWVEGNYGWMDSAGLDISCSSSSQIVRIYNNLVANNSSQGASGSGVHVYGGTIDMRNNVIIGNTTTWDGYSPESMLVRSARLVFRNNILADPVYDTNATYVEIRDTSNLDWAYNAVGFPNAVAPLMGVTPLGPGNLTTYPGFCTNSTANKWDRFRPAVGSPLLDAGDPDPAFADPDGTRCDIGVFGGPFSVGAALPLHPRLGVSLNAGRAVIVVNGGTPGGTCAVQAARELPTTNWTQVGIVASPGVLMDTNSAFSRRFYRAVQVQ